SDKGKGPIFRSYPPGISGTRIFPKLEAILGEEKLSIGEVYPATTRELNFRLTVRDNLGALSSPLTSIGKSGWWTPGKRLPSPILREVKNGGRATGNR
ncbi:hypothetical protein, partial [Streptomyces sp. A1136]|uniref:hypothetical protein n=1 Tax=Streptomyces sp. A1136 TaxID=2563102 RepID=UPI0019CF5E61